MDTLTYIVDKYALDLSKPSPIEIPNVSRDILGEWFKELGFMRGVELGVERGIYSKILLDAHPAMELHCVDAWTQYPEYRARVNDRHLPGKFKQTQEYLKGYNVVFHKAFSKQAVHHFEDNSLDFVYIDANHDLPWVMNDIMWWEKKVRVGGIIAGHDYIRARESKPTRIYVVEAVAWYTELKPIKTWFLLGTRAKVEGQIRDNNRSWLWVKE